MHGPNKSESSKGKYLSIMIVAGIGKRCFRKVSAQHAFSNIISPVYVHAFWAGTPELGGAGGEAAPVALYQEGQGGKGALSI
jgi:hypothetical protein